MSRIVFVETTGLGNAALAYARERGHTTTLLWSPRYHFYASPEVRAQAVELVDLAIEVDDLQDHDKVVKALHDKGITASEVDIVLTTLQVCVLPAAHLAQEFGARGTSAAGLAAARDKARCRRILDTHGIPNLGFAEVTNADQALAAARRIGYPVVVKPVNGFGKAATTIASGPDDVRVHFAEVSDRLAALEPGVTEQLDNRFLVEEFAAGPLISVEVATDGTSYTPLIAVRRKLGADNPALELGSTVPTGLDAQVEAAIGGYAAHVCRALGLDLGVFHVEIVATRQGPRLIEVNPRIAGGTVPEVISAATDRSVFETLIELFEGNPVPPAPYPVQRAASHSFLAVTEDVTVRADLPADWFEAYRPRLHSGSSSITAGSELRRMDTNWGTYGVVRALGETAADAERRCARIRDEIESLLRIPFVPVSAPATTVGAP